ncbi:MAG: ISAzo13 family transposase, partial [Acidobacteria bacterium]
ELTGMSRTTLPGFQLFLTRRGHPVSDKTVARMLDEMGYSLQLNRKEKEGPQHPDRDAQFRYINRQEASFRASGDPVISADTKKKELVGAFKNGGRTWRPKGNPYEVQVHDWPSQAKGKAIPYGVYDVFGDRAVVNVGISHDTAEFAAESIRRWWRLDGRRRYRSARRLLICADGGGSNSSRTHAWKANLMQLVDEIGIPITVSHYPPGTSNVEPDRASGLLVYQSDLERAAALEPGNGDQPDWRDTNPHRSASESGAGYQEVRDRG